MRFVDLVATSLTSLWQRKVRTSLTVLGVTIGTISVVVMISLGLGLTKSQYDAIESLGSLKQVLVHGTPNDPTGRTKPPRMDDKLARTLAGYDGVVHVVPVYQTSITVKVGRFQSWGQVVGIPRESLEWLDLELAEGELPGSRDLEIAAGHMVAENLYVERTGESFRDSGEELVGRKVTLDFVDDGFFGEQQEEPNKPKLKPLQAKISSSIAGPEGSYTETSDTLLVDLEVLRKAMAKTNQGKALPGQETDSQGRQKGTFTYSMFKVVTGDIKDTEPLLKTLRDEGYQADAPIEWIKQTEKQLAQVQAIFGGIGAISLLVAAIGIANTMMMSVYERTREVGVMKVLGASLRDIRLLFLIEAAGIGFVGGVIGILGSLLASAALNSPGGVELLGPALGINGSVPSENLTMSVIPLWLVGATLLFATVIGTVAGVLPAHRATRLSALEAIRSQ